MGQDLRRVLDSVQSYKASASIGTKDALRLSRLHARVESLLDEIQKRHREFKIGPSRFARFLDALMGLVSEFVCIEGTRQSGLPCDIRLCWENLSERDYDRSGKPIHPLGLGYHDYLLIDVLFVVDAIMEQCPDVLVRQSSAMEPAYDLNQAVLEMMHDLLKSPKPWLTASNAQALTFNELVKVIKNWADREEFFRFVREKSYLSEPFCFDTFDAEQVGLSRLNEKALCQFFRDNPSGALVSEGEQAEELSAQIDSFLTAIRVDRSHIKLESEVLYDVRKLYNRAKRELRLGQLETQKEIAFAICQNSLMLETSISPRQRITMLLNANSRQMPGLDEEQRCFQKYVADVLLRHFGWLEQVLSS